MVPTFASVDEIENFDYSNESYRAVLSRVSHCESADEVLKCGLVFKPDSFQNSFVQYMLKVNETEPIHF